MFYSDLKPDEFRILRSKKIKSYFTSAPALTFTLNANESEKTQFLKDLSLLLKSRQGMQGRSNAKEFRNWWSEQQPIYLVQPVIKEHEELSLSEFIDEIYLHFLTDRAVKQSTSKITSSLKKVFKNRLVLTSIVTIIFLFEKLGGFLCSLVVLGPGVQMFNSYTQPMVTPLAQTASQTGSRDLAPASSVIQSWLTNRAKVKEIGQELHRTSNELKKVGFEKMSPERSQEKWAEFEEAYFKLFLKYNQTLPSHLRDGRTAFKDFIVLTPVGLASNLSTFDTQYWIHRRELEALGVKKGEEQRKYTSQEQKLVHLHKEEMEAAENRIAGTLAAWKLFEFMYPEYSNQSEVQEGKSHLQNGYKTFVKSMRFDLYVKQFSKQIDGVLNQMDSLTEDQTAKADKKINTKVQFPAWS